MIEKLLAVGLSNAIVVTGLAVVVLAVTRSWRHAPLAHSLWLVVLVKLVTPPVFDLPVVIPVASEGVAGVDTRFTRDMGTHDGDGPRPVVVAPRSDGSIELRSNADTSGDNAGGLRSHHRQARETAGERKPRGERAFAPGATNENHTAHAMLAEPWLTWTRAAIAIWVAGALVVTATVLLRVYHFRRLMRHTAAAPRELLDEVAWLAQLTDAHIVPDVRVSGARVAPLVFGVGKAAVMLLPKSLLSSLRDEERTTMLAHELAHLRRRDHWLTWFELLVVSIYWWHPVAWFARRQLRHTADQCCDGWVVKWFPDKAMAYANSMMKTVDFLSGGRWLEGALASGFGQLNPLKRRFEMVLESRTSYCLELPLRFTVFSAAMLLLSFSPILVLGERAQDRASPDALGPEAGQSSDEDRAGAAGPNSLRAHVPDLGTVELVGLASSSDRAFGWWAADGSRAELPELEGLDLRDQGTVAAFRLAPDHLRFNGYFLRGSSMLKFKETWGSGSDGVILGAIDHPEGRRFGNLMLRVRGPGRRVHTFALESEDAGMMRRINQFGVQAFVGMKTTGPSQFKVTVLHTSDVAKEHLAAVDRADRLHVPIELSQQRADQYATTLTFGFPAEQVAGIAITEPTAASVQFRNVALRADVKAKPVVAVRTYDQTEPEKKDERLIVTDPQFRAELRDVVVVELLGAVRYDDKGLTWWGPEGEAIAPVPGILESDVEGYGTVVALHFPSPGYGFSQYIERNGERERLKGGAYVASFRTWLVHLDPAAEMEEATLVLDLTGGEPTIVQTVPIAPADFGREKIVNQGVIEKIGKIEAVSPEACKIVVFHEMKTRGLEFVVIDKEGNVENRNRGSFGRGRAEMTFPLPLEQLQAIAVQQKERAEVRFAGISLQPGHRTQLAVEVKDLTEPYTIEPAPPTPPTRPTSPEAKPGVAETPLRVAGRVTDAKTGQPIERFTVVPGDDSRGAGNLFFRRRSAQEFSGGQYDFTLPKTRYAHPVPKLVRYVRIEAEGYPAAISRGFRPSEGKVTLDLQLRVDAGISAVVRSRDGTPLQNATIVVCLETRGTFVNNNQVRPDDTNLLSLRSDSSGRFLLSQQDAAYAVLVLHEEGFGLATLEGLQATGEVVVSPWAKVKGTLRIGDRPGAGQTMFLNFLPLEHLQTPGPGHVGMCTINYTATTDDAGQFAFPQVPGMEGRIGRRMKLMERGGGYMASASPSMNIEVKPGEELQWNIGGEGRAVVGRMTLPDWFDESVDWTWSFGQLRPIQPYLDDLSYYERLRRYAEWRKTPAGRAHWLAERSYGFKLNADGSFRVDDVVAGKYELSIRVSQRPTSPRDRSQRTIGTVKREVTMPKVTPDLRSQPFDLGQMELGVTSLPNAQRDGGN